MDNTDTIRNEIHRLLKADPAFSTIEVETKVVGQYMNTTEYLVTPTPEGAAKYGVQKDGILYITFFVDNEVAHECGVSVGEVMMQSDDAIIEGSTTKHRKVFERKSKVKARNDLAKTMYNIVSAHAAEEAPVEEAADAEPDMRVAASSADAVATAIVNAVASSKLGQGIISARTPTSTDIAWKVGTGFGTNSGAMYGVVATITGNPVKGYKVEFSKDIPMEVRIRSMSADSASMDAAKLIKMVKEKAKSVEDVVRSTLRNFKG